MKQNTHKATIAMTDLGNSWFRRFMKGKYIKSLQKTNADVKLFHWELTQEQAEQIVRECDGVLLPGGADLNPAYYGKEKQEWCGQFIPARDAGETLILKEALKQGKPILGICRGFQLINCYFGGTLYQDIKKEAGEGRKEHMNIPGSAREVHKITVTPGTRLSQIAGSGRMGVNSLHHQAACTVGDVLTVAAISEDGFVEALEAKDGPFMLAVQWHPEHLFPKQAFARRIFAAFVEACEQSH